jgi:hypothetical protein
VVVQKYIFVRKLLMLESLQRTRKMAPAATVFKKYYPTTWWEISATHWCHERVDLEYPTFLYCAPITARIDEEIGEVVPPPE